MYMNLRPFSFAITTPIILEGLIVEGISVIVALLILFVFFKKHGFYKTIAFFLPLFLLATYLEGDWITHGRFEFHKFNFFIWDTPVAIVLYYSTFYLIFLLYQYFGKGITNRIKALLIHLTIDVLITTPLAIIFGYWSFRSTLFSFYPFIVPAVHIGEVLRSIVLCFVSGMAPSNKQAQAYRQTSIFSRSGCCFPFDILN